MPRMMLYVEDVVVFKFKNLKELVDEGKRLAEICDVKWVE
jgi:hypothetical protein